MSRTHLPPDIPAELDLSAPSYRRIEFDLRRRVETGFYPAGSLLPSRRDLARAYSVDVGMIQRAIRALLEDGTLRSEGWRGTFVAGRPASPIPGNANAQLPRTKFTIGIVGVLPLSGQYMKVGHDEFWGSTMLRGVERSLANRAGVTTRFANLFDGNRRRCSTFQVISALLDTGLDGIVLVYETSDQDVDEALLATKKHGTPIVFASTSALNCTASYVTYNDVTAGFDAARHLIENGWRDLLFFSTFAGAWPANRLAGVREAAMRAGLKDNAITVWTGENLDPARTNQIVVSHEIARRRWHSIGGRPYGVIGVNDRTAIGFLRAAHEFGSREGRDFGIVGFDDTFGARENNLTSLSPPIEDIGQEAGRIALRLLRGEQTTIQTLLSSHLIARESSRPKQLGNLIAEVEYSATR